MDDHADKSRARKAAQELEMTAAAFEGLRTAALEALVATGPEQFAKREKLYLTCSILEAVKASLIQSAAAGAVADYRIALAEQNLLRP